MAAWANSTTQFALAALIILAFLALLYIIRFILFPACDPTLGRKGRRAAAVNEEEQRDHWTVRPMSFGCMGFVQFFTVFALVLAAMATDRWSVASAPRYGYTNMYNHEALQWGLLKSEYMTGHTGTAPALWTPSTSYEQLCADPALRFDDADEVACGTLRAGGITVLIFGLSWALASFALFCAVLPVCGWAPLSVSPPLQWEKRIFRLSIFQFIAGLSVILIWSISTHVTILEAPRDGSDYRFTLGRSWTMALIATVECMLITWYIAEATEWHVGDRLPPSQFEVPENIIVPTAESVPASMKPHEASGSATK